MVKAISRNSLVQIIYLPYNHFGEPETSVQPAPQVPPAKAKDGLTGRRSLSVRSPSMNRNLAYLASKQWSPEEDEFMLRVSHELTAGSKPEDNMEADSSGSTENVKTNEPILESAQRQLIHVVIDPDFGPQPDCFIRIPASTPLYLSRAHENLRRRYATSAGRSLCQYTPWAMNALAPEPMHTRSLAFTLETDRELKAFSQVN
ncbi:unnamed protein product [Protopolystoma xenopodis]|uniref:Uncharacterized protein n=1 Tax=Protopolystoma xenopodis TaxID=117903 RepID=A0A3S5ANX3_9PLAT|nr:unnamed protein product [Protopolystoma xenopodis]